MQMVEGHILNCVLTLFLQLLFTGEVLPVLARPGLLDLWQHPGVCRGLCGSGGLHHPQVLHPSGTHECLIGFLGVRLGASTVRTAAPPQPTHSMAETLTETVVAGLEHVTDRDRVSGSRT